MRLASVAAWINSSTDVVIPQIVAYFMAQFKDAPSQGRTSIGFAGMSAREAHDWNNASRLGTAKPVVSCELATRTNNASTTHEPTWWLFATSSPTHLPRPSG